MAKITKKAIREEKMNRLAVLFGATTGEKIGRPCRSFTEYFVKFNNGVEFYITNRMSRFDEAIDRIITKYENFINNKDKFMEILNNRKERDAKIAKEYGYKEYEILDVNFAKDGNYLGWFYIKMNIDGVIKCFTETGFNYAMVNTDKLTKEMNRKTEYYTAGGMNDNDVDFVFNNVGFSSKKNMYEIF